jgi:hypothetical protein
MGANIFQPENIQQPTLASFDFFGGITPVKTEPLVLRAVSELISAQVLTQQIVSQLATLQIKTRGGQAFITQGIRPEEGTAYDESVEPVRLLTQKIQELEKRLDEVAPRKSAAASR